MGKGQLKTNKVTRSSNTTFHDMITLLITHMIQPKMFESDAIIHSRGHPYTTWPFFEKFDSLITLFFELKLRL